MFVVATIRNLDGFVRLVLTLYREKTYLEGATTANAGVLSFDFPPGQSWKHFAFSLFIRCVAGSLDLWQQSLQPTVATTKPVLFPSCTTSYLNCLTLGNTFPGGNNDDASCSMDSKCETCPGE
jgi:hypothetical protein